MICICDIYVIGCPVHGLGEPREVKLDKERLIELSKSIREAEAKAKMKEAKCDLAPVLSSLLEEYIQQIDEDYKNLMSSEVARNNNDFVPNIVHYMPNFKGFARWLKEFK